MPVEKKIISTYLLNYRKRIEGRRVKMPGFFTMKETSVLGVIVEKQMYVNRTKW